MDDNRKRFEARLRLLDECPGVQARAVQTRKRAVYASNEKIERAVRPLQVGVRLVLICLGFFVLKAGFAEITGPESYDNQVAAMANQEGWPSIVAVVMERGPVMRWAEPAISQIMDGEASMLATEAFNNGTVQATRAAEE